MAALQIFLLCALIAYNVVAQSSSDSQGTDFVTMFMRNQASGNTILTLTFINSNPDMNATVVTVGKYYNTTLSQMSDFSDTSIVANQGFISIQLPQGFAWPFLSAGLQNQPDQRIRISSTIPITVIASNVDNIGDSADRYIVPPIAMLGTSYSFALETTGDNQQYNMVYMFPTDNAASFTFNIFYENQVGNVANISDTLQLDANPADIPYYANSFAMSGYVTSTAPIALLVGSTARRVSLNRYDHQVFMLLPFTNDISPLPDVHASTANDDSTTTEFFITGAPAVSASYVVMGNSSINGTLTPTSLTRVVSTDGLGPLLTFASNETSIQVVRHLGKDASQLGASLSLVPSISQFVCGSTRYMSFAYGDSFQVSYINRNGMEIGDCPNQYLAIDSLPGYYTYRGFLVFANPRTHNFYSPGTYTLYIYGGNLTGTYSYVPAYNRLTSSNCVTAPLLSTTTAATTLFTSAPTITTTLTTTTTTVTQPMTTTTLVATPNTTTTITQPTTITTLVATTITTTTVTQSMPTTTLITTTMSTQVPSSPSSAPTIQSSALVSSASVLTTIASNTTIEPSDTTQMQTNTTVTEPPPSPRAAAFPTIYSFVVYAALSLLHVFKA